MTTQAEKARTFRALHERDKPFIIPNPWDVGTARLLQRLGFEAVATTSAGYAFSVGQPDNTISRDETLAHVAEIVSATDLPVSGDLENGFGDTPEVVAETVRLAADAGLVGGSIEDVSQRPGCTVYELEHAAERVRAAAEVARNLPFPFTVTARAENYLVGTPDLLDTIGRLQAYQEAGADVLYAPGLSTKDDIATVVKSVDRPVNVGMGRHGVQLSLAELLVLGVKRISVGSALARTALGAFLGAAQEMKDKGTFAFAEEAASFGEINAMFKENTGRAERPRNRLEALPRLQGLFKRPSSRIAVKTNGRIVFVNPSDVVAVEAEGNYVLLQQRSGSYLLRESISAMAEKLKPFGFVRIHRSVLINSSYVAEIEPCLTGEYALRIRGGKEYTVTRTYKKGLRSLAEFWIGADSFLA